MVDHGASIIKLALFAVGGQGGGVLSNWIVAVAEANGWRAQATAVAGVAQRTGATFYYVEMAPPSERVPVFALAPSEGDVDIVMASELMEAGRAIMRGFVTPTKTTLIASEHRMLSVAEKIAPGSGIASPADTLLAAELSSSQCIIFDMEKIARESGTVVSASLLGALAGSAALPFPVESYTTVIESGGRNTAANHQAFNLSMQRVGELHSQPDTQVKAAAVDGFTVAGPQPLLDEWAALIEQLNDLPEAAQEIARHGLRRVVDYQDVAYGSEYLSRVQPFAEMDSADTGAALTNAAAKHIANAMCYDDVIRVADLKTRGARSARIKGEYGADGAVLKVTEFMHPRGAELISTLPHRLAKIVNARPSLVAFIDRRVNKGRRLRSDRVVPFLLLYGLGGMRKWRRSLARHHTESEHIDNWLAEARRVVKTDYHLAVEILHCRRLVKGYSDTHLRGLSKFDRVLAMVPSIEKRNDAAQQLRKLHEAALQDADGDGLQEALGVLGNSESLID